MRVLRIRTISQKASWAKQITLVRDNCYKILKSSKKFNSFEFFNFKILKWPLALICHYLPNYDKYIL